MRWVPMIVVLGLLVTGNGAFLFVLAVPGVVILLLWSAWGAVMREEQARQDIAAIRRQVEKGQK